jgi:transitional endoplasmic reticulum ATPase
MTSEFLQQLDGIKSSNGVVFVGATNRPDKVDPSVLRPGRIDRFIFVPPPGSDDRALLFEKNLSKAPISRDMDFKRLAAMTDGYTGADISNICRQAKLNALEENVSTSNDKPIETDDIVKVIRFMKPSAPSSTLGAYMSFISLYGGR